MRKTSDILAKATDRIRPEGAWTRNVFARDKDGESVYPNSPHAVCYCIDGAIAAECPPGEGEDHLGGTSRISHDLSRVGWDAETRVGFNDTHSQAEVIAEAEGKVRELEALGL